MNSLDDLKRTITQEKILNDRLTTSNTIPSSSRGPSPNRGASVRDVDAIKDEMRKRDWQRSRDIDTSKQVRIVKLSHMRYQHPDLDAIGIFLKDFGMHTAQKTSTERWYRGYGPDQYVYYARQGPKAFLGGTFQVESRHDLEKVLAVPNIKLLTDGIKEMKDAPGGGFIVTIEDPQGFPVNFVWGQEALVQDSNARERKHPPRLLLNDETHKPREKRFQRFSPGPAEVYKLGHFGLNVADFPAAMDWYTRHFNIIPSDILYVEKQPDSSNPNSTTTTSSSSSSSSSSPTPNRKEVALFAHIDRDDTLVDHHTMFLTTLTPGVERHVHHCSFEVHDYDTQELGHQWLAAKGYDPVWGVGRHILGSQIFDYWWDINGFMVEHYADGDVVNIDTPIGFGPAGNEGLAVWGPDVPTEFLE